MIGKLHSHSKYTKKFLGGAGPWLKNASFISKDARIIGAVRLGQDVSVFPFSVLRADINEIVVGDRTNIQDGSIMHVTSKLPLRIGCDVSVGHGAILHACNVEDCVLVGMGSILLDGCHIGSESIVAAGSLVSMGKTFPPRSLILGNPARRIRSVTDVEIQNMKESIQKYILVAKDHLLFEERKQIN